MTNEELIGRLKEWHENLISELCADDILTCDDLCGCTGDCIVLQAISALRQQENPQWISVKVRLPEQTDPAQKVLFVTKTGGLFIGCYYKATAYDQFDGWYSMCVRIDNVTHWMPLPEPPEEEKV